MNITYEYYWAGVAVFTANNSDHNHARKANNLGLNKIAKSLELTNSAHQMASLLTSYL